MCVTQLAGREAGQLSRALREEEQWGRAQHAIRGDDQQMPPPRTEEPRALGQGTPNHSESYDNHLTSKKTIKRME